MTRDAGLAEPAYPTQTAAWADFDLDGDLDLYVGNEGSGNTAISVAAVSQRRRRHLHRRRRAAGVRNDRYAKAVTWGDYDNDGDPDLYVSTNNAPNRLYRNDGDERSPTCAEDWASTLPARRSFATWFFDYDNDGWLDLFVGNFETPPGKVMAAYFGAQSDSGAAAALPQRPGQGLHRLGRSHWA